MKQNLKDFASFSSGAAILLEALIAYAKAHSAADVMYYICRVFGVALPLHIAIPLRIALISLGGYNLISSINRIAPKLWYKLKTT